MNSSLAYLNGRFMPFAQAVLPLHDAGFVSGATIVDNARTFRHKLFRWSDHLARFRRDCMACLIPLEATNDHITALAEELVAHNAKLLPTGGELQLVTFATPGPLGFYVGEVQNGPPTLGMVTYPLPVARFRPFFTEGATLAVVGLVGPRTDSVVPPTIKHRSRIFWHVADQKARTLTGVPHALAISVEADSLVETSVANFLAVIDGVVTSPPRNQALDGISRRVIAELCGGLGIAFVEAPLVISELTRMSEAMVTGTAFCVAGVRTLYRRDGVRSQFDWPGSVFRRLLAAWNDQVGMDIEKQFTSA